MNLLQQLKNGYIKYSTKNEIKIQPNNPHLKFSNIDEFFEWYKKVTEPYLDIEDGITTEDYINTLENSPNKTEGFFVDTVLWMKREQPLSTILCDHQIPSRLISASRL